MQEHCVKGTFPGRAPVVLAGPDVTEHEVFTAKHREFIVAATRDGKGFSVATNASPFKILKTKEVSVPNDVYNGLNQLQLVYVHFTIN